MISDSLWNNYMSEINQAKQSNLVERITNKLKVKSVRTQAQRWDDINEVNYTVRDGYNMEVSIMIFDVICAVTGVINFDNAIRAIRVIKNFVPTPVKAKLPKPVIKSPKPSPKPKAKVVNFKLECKECKDVKDIRHDFYKGRRICKSCYSKQVVNKRKGMIS